MVSFTQIERWAASQPEVAHWLRSFASSTRQQYLRSFYLFLNYLKSRQGYGSITVPVLIEHARKDPLKVFDAVQGFVSTIDGAESYGRKTHGAVISFFLHNRACICESCLRTKSLIRDELASSSTLSLQLRPVSRSV